MKKIRAVLLAIAVCIALLPPAVPPADASAYDGQALEVLIEGFMAQHKLNANNFSLAYFNTVTGETYMYNGHRLMNAASVYKLPLNMYYYEQVALGRIDPNSRYAGYPLSQCHRLSLQYSDNATSQAMRRAAGTYSEYKIALDKYTGVSAEEIGGAYLTGNYFNALSILNTLKYLYENSVFFSEAIGYLKAANPGGFFKRDVSGYEIAQKYGWLMPAVNTAGIVYTPTPYLLCVFTENVGYAEAVIGKLNKLICDYTVEKNSDSAARTEFLDVRESDWYYGFVYSALESGIINGAGDGKFIPGDALKVSEAVKLAAVIYSVSGGGDGGFERAEPWYRAYEDYAIQNGIIRADDFFDLERSATRAEVAYILANCVSEDKLEAINPVDYLPDINESGRYGDSVYRLYRAGVLTGFDALGTFRPDAWITRAEAAAIAMRIVNPDLRISFEIQRPPERQP